MFLWTLSKYLFNTDRLGVLTTSLESLLQDLTIPSVKKCFLTSCLTLPWCSFELSLQLDHKVKRKIPPSSLPLLRKLYRAKRSCVSFLFSKLEKHRALNHSLWDISSSPLVVCYRPLLTGLLYCIWYTSGCSLRYMFLLFCQ